MRGIAWHTTSYCVDMHNIFMQKTNSQSLMEISPMCRHANTGSYTCTLEQTGTTQACEYRRREERYVALSLPHTRRDQD